MIRSKMIIKSPVSPVDSPKNFLLVNKSTKTDKTKMGSIGKFVQPGVYWKGRGFKPSTVNQNVFLILIF